MSIKAKLLLVLIPLLIMTGFAGLNQLAQAQETPKYRVFLPFVTTKTDFPYRGINPPPDPPTPDVRAMAEVTRE